MEFAVSCVSGVLSCFVLALAYVGSLYLWTSKFSRNHPSTIKRRFFSVLLVTLAAPPYVWLWANNTDKGYSLWEWLGIRTAGIGAAAVLPLVLTMILFLGPIVMVFYDGISSYFDLNLLKSEVSSSLWWRNYWVAPFTEEFVFRACMLPLLISCLGFSKAVFICPLFFGVAHIHHVIERLRFQGRVLSNPSYMCQRIFFLHCISVFQFCYTTVFGAYTAFLFLRTGHLVAPVICHSFCNLMGFPAFGEISSYGQPRSSIISIAFVAGLIAFIFLLFPMTSSSFFNNKVYAGFI
ncbi:CAAX prenyl protease 2-like [Ptychodera flava]|uniref:CAAX prenyl protease 2-like n=1 Tax=Ptychodera flava TaxID=63121 RepID=UPI00396AA723